MIFCIQTIPACVSSCKGDGRGMWQEWGDGCSIQILVGNLRERDHLRNLGLCRRMILKMDMQELEWACAGLTWLISVSESLLLR